MSDIENDKVISDSGEYTESIYDTDEIIYDQDPDEDKQYSDEEVKNRYSCLGCLILFIFGSLSISGIYEIIKFLCHG